MRLSNFQTLPSQLVYLLSQSVKFTPRRCQCCIRTYKVLLNLHIYSDNLRGQRLYSQKLRIEVSGYNEFKMVKISIFIIRIKKYNNGLILKITLSSINTKIDPIY